MRSYLSRLEIVSRVYLECDWYYSITLTILDIQPSLLEVPSILYTGIKHSLHLFYLRFRKSLLDIKIQVKMHYLRIQKSEQNNPNFDYVRGPESPI